MFGIGLNIYTNTLTDSSIVPPTWNIFTNSNFLFYLENGSDLLLAENNTDAIIQEQNLLMYLENATDNLMMENNSTVLLTETYTNAL